VFRSIAIAISCAACVTTSVSGPEPVFLDQGPPGATASDGGIAPARQRGFVLTWGKQGSAPGEFRFPIGLAVNRANEVLVSDYRNARIQKFDTEGRLLGSFATLPTPGAIAVDASGDVYITHFSVFSIGDPVYPARVSRYTASGTFVREWGRTGKGDGEFDYPGGIAVTPDGRVYVADQTNRRVQIFDTSGTFLGKWGEYGTDAGQFGGDAPPSSRSAGPQFVAVDSRGDVFTTEGSMGRIQRFDASGKYLASFGSNDNREGAFGSPTSGLQGPIALVADRQDHVWISAVSGRIQRFTRDGKFLEGFGGYGNAPGMFNIPHGIALDGRGDLYVADTLNHRVQKFIVTP
jgi:DNA-binding beta-propeller fold protein YncE